MSVSREVNIIILTTYLYFHFATNMGLHYTSTGTSYVAGAWEALNSSPSGNQQTDQPQLPNH